MHTIGRLDWKGSKVTSLNRTRSELWHRVSYGLQDKEKLFSPEHFFHYNFNESLDFSSEVRFTDDINRKVTEFLIRLRQYVLQLS